MARIEYSDPSKASERTREILGKNRNANIFRMVAHTRIGKNVGVTDEQNEALEDWKSASCFNEVQRAALAFTDEIVRLRRPTDATFNAIAAKLTPAALIELQLSVGFYIMTSKFLETFGIDMQPATEAV